MNTQRKGQIALQFLINKIALQDKSPKDQSHNKAFERLAELTGEPVERLRQIALQLWDENTITCDLDRLGEIALTWLTKMYVPQLEFRFDNELRRRVGQTAKLSLGVSVEEAYEFVREILTEVVSDTFRPPRL